MDDPHEVVLAVHDLLARVLDVDGWQNYDAGRRSFVIDKRGAVDAG